MAEWKPKDYTPYFLTDKPRHTAAEIATEYSRMRKLMLARADELQKIGESARATYIRKSVPTLADLRNTPITVNNKTGETRARTKEEQNRLIAKTLANTNALREQRSYSVKGLKEIQSHIKEETGEVVPLGEVLGFADYMKSWRLSAFSAMIVPSSEAAELHPNEYQEIGGSFSDFWTLYKETQS